MKKGVLIFLLMIAMMLIVTQGAFARTGCWLSTGTYVETLAEPTAPGTKVTGVLAIVYTDIGKKCSEIGYPDPPQNDYPAAKMTFVMRLYRNNVFIPFSDSAEVCYPLYQAHTPYITNFITQKVIPIVFNVPVNTLSWKLKSVYNVIEDDNNNPNFAGCCWENFSIMDITIAVQ